MLINHDLDLFYGKVNIGCPYEWGKLFNCHLKGITCRKWASALKILNSEKILTAGFSLPPPLGNIHVYYKNIKRLSSLKALGQSKPKFT